MLRQLLLRPVVPNRIDLLLGVGLSVFLSVMLSWLGHWQPNATKLDGIGYGLILGTTLPLVIRRRYPLPVVVFIAAVTVVYFRMDYPNGPGVLPAAAALCTLAVVTKPLYAGVTGVTLAVLSLLVDVLAGDRESKLGGHAIGLFVWVVVSVSVGTAIRTRKAAVMAERNRAEEEIRRRQEEQRLRVAREVHDVVAHSLAMINVQAGVAAHVADRRPEQAKAALLAIKEASRTALADLRATLGVLRSGEDRAPAPSLERMRELVDGVTAAGLRVEVDGEAGELPAPVDVAAYRILQEALTNAVRHAKGATMVSIRLRRPEGELELTVTDDGAPQPPSVAGNGRRGMRERATALGGSVEADPVPGGGFAVRLRLPVQGDD